MNKEHKGSFLKNKFTTLFQRYKSLDAKMKFLIGLRVFLWLIILSISFYGAINILIK